MATSLSSMGGMGGSCGLQQRDPATAAAYPSYMFAHHAASDHLSSLQSSYNQQRAAAAAAACSAAQVSSASAHGYATNGHAQTGPSVCLFAIPLVRTTDQSITWGLVRRTMCHTPRIRLRSSLVVLQPLVESIGKIDTKVVAFVVKSKKWPRGQLQKKIEMSRIVGTAVYICDKLRKWLTFFKNVKRSSSYWTLNIHYSNTFRLSFLFLLIRFGAVKRLSNDVKVDIEPENWVELIRDDIKGECSNGKLSVIRAAARDR